MAWEIDAIHSRVRFSVHQLEGTIIRGQFGSVRGYLHVDKQKPAHSWVDVEVDTASVNTGDADRDARLRSKDVLDVDEYPTITFKSVRVNHVVSREYTVSGELTLHGVTRLVTFDVGFQEPGGSKEVQLAELNARAHIKCGDFGVQVAGFPAAGHQIALGESVRIDFDLALASHESESLRSSA